MKYLVEGYSYKPEVLEREIAKGLRLWRATSTGLCTVDHVGYFYQPQTKCCYYIIPKVFLKDDNSVIGKYTPERLLQEGDDALLREDRRFFHQFCIWTHQAIKAYAVSHPDNGIVDAASHLRVDASLHAKFGSLFDVVLALLEFHRENRDLIIQRVALSRKGRNKVNWPRTITKTPAFVNGKSVFYLQPVCKRKEIDYDEQLLIIFYSILAYIKRVFHFNVTIDVNFNLITGREFEHYLGRVGLSKLRQIRHRYFSDRFLYLWKLCYCFFENASRLNASGASYDCYLAKDFNIIFEAITDELIGDPAVDKKLKEQRDGKIVDHIFIGKSLLRNESIYYIVDSKYYKAGTRMGEAAIYKQYTYARNAITYNVCYSPRRGLGTESVPAYRDELTEGYDVTPNFFLSATMDFANLNHVHENLQEHNPEHPLYHIEHFKNRLFDRDTLWVLHCDINFLFLLKTYVSRNEQSWYQFRTRVREELRKKFLEHLVEEFDFCRTEKPIEIDDFCSKFIDPLFRKLNGKVLTSKSSDGRYLFLALEKNNETNKEILDIVHRHYDLGALIYHEEVLTFVPRNEIRRLVAPRGFLVKPENAFLASLTNHVLCGYIVVA